MNDEQMPAISNDQALAEMDFGDILGEIGSTFSEEDQIKASTFLKDQPKLRDFLLRLPQLETVNNMLTVIDNCLYKMGGEDRYAPDSITLIKKLDPNRPMFNVGTFKKGDGVDPLKEFKFLPLFAYKSKVYFKDYNSGEKGAHCTSTNDFQGAFSGDPQHGPHVRKCADCPFKDWGSDRDGSVDPKRRTPPLCRQQFTVLGVTPEFDNFYEMTMSKYCLAKQGFNAHNNFLVGGKLMARYIPNIDGVDEDVKAEHYVNMAQLNQKSIWLEVSGEQVKDAKGQIVSAGTVVRPTKELLTKEQTLYASLMFKFGERYVDYLMSNFAAYLERMNEQSAEDTDAIPTTAESVIDEAELVDDALDTEE